MVIQQIKRRIVAGMVSTLCLCFVAACQAPQPSMTSPRNLIKGSKFLHKYTMFSRPFGAKSIHVYISGDGLPWLAPGKVAADPSTDTTVTQALIQQDLHRAMSSGVILHLGRPCYHQTQDAQCHPRWWTDARYADEVVDSMILALRKISDKYMLNMASDSASLVLIGYSGGGTIATLMASRMKEVDGLVTFAANLDIGAWTQYHAYSNLAHSLNPVDHPISHNVMQWHISSSDDKNVPPHLNAEFFTRHTSTSIQLEGVKHDGDWHRHWAGIMQRYKIK